MPIPVSKTSISQCRLAVPRRRSAIRTPPLGVYFSALPIRLRSTRSSSIGSPCARQPGRWRPTCRRRRKRFSWACGANSSTRRCISGTSSNGSWRAVTAPASMREMSSSVPNIESIASTEALMRSASAFCFGGQLLGLEGGQVEPERMQRLAQVVACGGEEGRLRAVRGFGGVARIAHRLHRGDQLLALRRDAAFEVGVEHLELAGRDDEAVDQDPADQQQEQQAGIGRQEGRVVVVAEVGQPVAQPERDRGEAGRRQQHAVDVALAPGVARHRGEADRGDQDQTEAPDDVGVLDHAGRRGRVQHDGRQQRHGPQRAVEARPVPAGEADAEDHQHRDEERVQRGPPDVAMERREQRRRQHRPRGVRGPRQRRDRRSSRTSARSAGAATARARTAPGSRPSSRPASGRSRRA